MNENEMLNDKPIFVAKSRTFHGLILAATGLMMALVIYFLAQESEANKLKQVVGCSVLDCLFVGQTSFWADFSKQVVGCSVLDCLVYLELAFFI